jgi:ribosomal protein L11 methyltransferase
MRLEARVAEGDVELAIAECHALTGVGCLQGEPAAGVVVLRIWMPWDDSPGADGLRDHLAAAGIAAHVDQAEEGREWQSALRDFHQPVVAGRIRVRPPWVAPAPGMHDVVIDPGMAFGTGQHATTRTALELLQRIPDRGEVLDAGCGSGVLAIAARRIGMGPVTAIDFDPDSVSATTRAARANMVDGVTAIRATIGDDPMPGAPILLANITLEVLGILAEALVEPVTVTGVRHAVLSGLRESEVDAAVAAFAPLGLAERERLAEDGWASVRLSA